MKTKTKSFDCIEMKRIAAARIHAELESLTFEEKLEYWRKKNEEFEEEFARLKEQKPKP